VEVAAHNHALGPAGGDLGVVIFATPGDLPAQHEGRRSPPRVVVHTFPLAFMLWARAYSEGVSLRSVPVTQVPATSWPLALKCRSRMHYHLADQVAAAAEPGARAILCHPDGRVSETSTANIAIVRQGEILTPPPADSLAGISLGHVRGLALAHGIAWKERSLLLADLAAADEILLTSTPNCLLPATQFDGHPVGNGRPGDVYRRLLAAWSEGVGIDIARQARGAAG
jgi:branched-subunit amino acid aminotransferase/4-amino-4-deoxychorismate lyase